VSTLTKILIVLITVSSLFLCGIVVSYISSADDYREQNTKLKEDLQIAGQKQRTAEKQLKENIDKTQRKQDDLRRQIASLQKELGALKVTLKTVEREKGQLLQRVNNWTSLVEDFTKTNNQQGLLLDKTLNEKKILESQQIQTNKELAETAKALEEKLAIIDTQKSDIKRLIEEKTELQKKLYQLMLPGGKTRVSPIPVTPEKRKAKAAPVRTEVKIQGKVTKVNANESVVSVSIGSVDGVQQGMRLHVTRNDKFIRDILIIEVDAEESVGIFDLGDQVPKIGDKVSTSI